MSGLLDSHLLAESLDRRAILQTRPHRLAPLEDALVLELGERTLRDGDEDV